MSKIKIDGEVEIPKRSLPDLFSRIDDLLELLLKVESAQLQVLKTITGIEIPEIKPVVVKQALANRYDIFDFEVAVEAAKEYADKPVGLKAKNRVATFLGWESVDADVTYKLNSKANKSMVASAGVEHENFEISEIYVTKAAGKKGKIYYEWREE